MRKPLAHIVPVVPEHAPGGPDPGHGTNQCAEGRRRQVFAQYNGNPLAAGVDSLNDLDPNLVDVDQMISRTFVGPDHCPLPWIVHLWAREVERVAGLGSPVTPLPLSQIMAGNIFSRYKARIEWGGGNIRHVDFGQSFRVSNPSRFITVSLLLPAGNASFVNPPGPESTQPTLAGVVTDTNFGVEVETHTGGAIGNRLATHTQTVTILQTVANQFIELPPGTVRISIYQTGVGDPITGFWSLTSTPSVVAFNLGSIVVSAATLRALDLIRPGNAKGISTGAADADDDRVITVVSHLEI